jgi:hypothetical protein
MGKGLDTGKSFWQGVLGKITDPEQRAAAEKLLANPDVMTLVGNGVEGQAEIDRRLQDLTAQTTTLTDQRRELEEREAALETWHGQLTSWRQANTELLELGKRAKAGGGNPTPTPNPNPAPAPGAAGLTEDKLNEALRTQAGQFLGYDRDRSQIQREHFSKFKEIVDIVPLLEHPKIAELGLVGVYNLVHKDALAKHAEDQKKAEEERIRADERAKVSASMSTMPYPPLTGVNAGSPLDALKSNEGAGPLVEQATAEYTRLVAARQSAPS